MGVNPRELNELAKLCVAGDLPHCAAACPLYVDVRELARQMAAGDFAAARALLEKAVLLPHLLACVCDQPCAGHCRRNELDEPLQIRLLEQACLEFGAGAAVAAAAPPKERRVVVGGGLSGLFAAAALLKKGYPVTLYEQAQELGGRLRARRDAMAALDLDLPRLATLRLEMGVTVTEERLLQLADAFDAVYVGWGAAPSAHCLGEIQPFTQQSAIPNVFVGGSLLGQELAASPSRLAESGLRAANSIERLFQNVSLSANRTREGSCASALFTPLEGLAVQPATRPASDSGRYAAALAREEAARCIQCRCLVCRWDCVYLQEFDKHPGNSIRAVVKNVNIMTGWGTRDANTFIHSCTLCGRCGESCPSDIDMGFVNLNARRFMWEKEILPPAVHDFPLRDMYHSLETAPRPRHQHGFQHSKYALFAGCQLPASMPQTLRKLYGLLAAKLAGGVGLLAGCCGAPAEWAGREQEAAKVRARLRQEWAELGEPELLVCCPGCYKVFREGLPEIPLQFIAAVLPPLLPRQERRRTAFAYHDPCASRNDPPVQESGRGLAAHLGAAVAELPNHHALTECCGYGGLQYHINPALTRKTWGRRIHQSPLPYLTSCSNCRDFFRWGGKDCLHLLELVFGREEVKGSSPWAEIDFSKRRQVREQLYQEMGRLYWRERPGEKGTPMRLSFAEGLLEKMHKHCILEEDVRRILLDAQKDGRRMQANENGRLVTGRQYGYLTYWLEYTEADGVYHLHNCYSHRMQILPKDAGDR